MGVWKVPVIRGSVPGRGRGGRGVSSLFLGSSANLQIECDKSSAVNLISIHKSNSIKVKEMSVKSSREREILAVYGRRRRRRSVDSQEKAHKN